MAHLIGGDIAELGRGGKCSCATARRHMRNVDRRIQNSSRLHPLHGSWTEIFKSFKKNNSLVKSRAIPTHRTHRLPILLKPEENDRFTNSAICHAMIHPIALYAPRLLLVRSAERKQDVAETDGYRGDVGQEAAMQQQFDVFVAQAPSNLSADWGWIVALGLGLAFLGALAIWRARTATLVYVVFLGALLLAAALAILVVAFSLTGYWTAFFVHVLWAVLLAIIGFILISRPAISAEAITLVIAFYFLVTGVVGIGFALFSHIQGGWLSIFDGVVSAGLGVLLLAGWPVTGLWAIGLFVGINLILRGGEVLALGLSLRTLAQ